MGEKTGIEWCDSTWNPFIGCKKISAGCKNCYMYREQKRFGNDPEKIKRTATRTFNSPLRWKEPKLIFVCSWSDFFLEEVDQWRDDAWKIIKKANQHTYLLLTKRPHDITSRFPKDWNREDYKHVWFGVTAEDNSTFFSRGLALLCIEDHYNLDKRTFISFEPLLENIKLIGETQHAILQKVGWVIVGGESGGKVAREMNPDWAREIKGACAHYEIPFFFKQMTNHAPIPEDLSGLKARI